MIDMSFTIRDWKEGVKILDRNHKIPVFELSQKLNCSYHDAYEVVKSYCKIFKVKRPKEEHHKLPENEYLLKKIYRNKLKH